MSQDTAVLEEPLLEYKESLEWYFAVTFNSSFAIVMDDVEEIAFYKEWQEVLKP